jgi:hypothetical protein
MRSTRGLTNNDSGADRIDAFIRRWQGREGGQERANYALFLGELCAALGLPPPDPASATTEPNDYVFERAVREISRDGSSSSRRIDLYKRDSFVLEAKQSPCSAATRSSSFATCPPPSARTAASITWTRPRQVIGAAPSSRPGGYGIARTKHPAGR